MRTIKHQNHQHGKHFCLGEVASYLAGVIIRYFERCNSLRGWKNLSECKCCRDLEKQCKNVRCSAGLGYCYLIVSKERK